MKHRATKVVVVGWDLLLFAIWVGLFIKCVVNRMAWCAVLSGMMAVGMAFNAVWDWNRDKPYQSEKGKENEQS